MTRKRSGPQDIQVVDFPQQVLHVFQIVAPHRVIGWEEVLDNVPESFNADAQRVERHLRTRTHGARVQLTTRGPALKCQMFEHGTARTNPPSPRRECPGPLPPLLAVELCQSCPRLLLLLCLPGPQDV